MLPHGPAEKFLLDSSVKEKIENDDKYSLFVTRMEREVVSLMALDDKGAKQISGHADGPKFVQKNSFENEQGGSRGTTSVSGAWRRTAGWFDDLLKADRIVAKEVVMQKLLTYHHPSPAHLKATPEQIEGFASLSAWRKRLTRSLLHHSSWIRALKTVATANAEKGGECSPVCLAFTVDQLDA